MRERYQTLDIQQKLLWNLRDLGKTLHGMSEGRASQKRILVMLLRSGGMTQQELTERLEVRPGSASEVIGKLEGALLSLLERLSGHWEERFTGAEDRGCGRHHHRGGGC